MGCHYLSVQRESVYNFVNIKSELGIKEDWEVMVRGVRRAN